jgi:hypothetical protein
LRYLSRIQLDNKRISQKDIIWDMSAGYCTGIKEDMKDIERITLADMMRDIFSGYVQGYVRIC